jgi:hypothetical protein
MLRKKFILMLSMGKKIRVVRTIDVTELGRAGGHARAAAMTDAQRSEAARQAVQARWDRYYAEHPEKRKTARTAASRNRISKKAKK